MCPAVASAKCVYLVLLLSTFYVILFFFSNESLIQLNRSCCVVLRTTRHAITLVDVHRIFIRYSPTK